MATLGFSDTKGMIRYENGLYRWVPGTDTWLDVDVFEDLARRALETSDPEELRTLGREAADLYQGDFLPDVADELWCAIFTPTIAPCSCGCSADWCKS